jgi:hypothetical protein
MTTLTKFEELADAFAQVDAELKALKVRYDDIRAQVIARGPGKLVGEFYTTDFSINAPSKRFNAELATAKMIEFGLTAEQAEAILNCKKADEEGAKRVTAKPTAPSVADAIRANMPESHIRLVA